MIYHLSGPRGTRGVNDGLRVEPCGWIVVPRTGGIGGQQAFSRGIPRVPNAPIKVRFRRQCGPSRDCACWRRSVWGHYFCGETTFTTAWSAVGVAIMSTCVMPGTMVTAMFTSRL